MNESLAHYLKRFAWLLVAIAAGLLALVSPYELLGVVAGVVLVVAATVGYFVEANAFVNLAPRNFRLFSVLLGALCGGVLGLSINPGHSLLGMPAWPVGGVLVGVALGSVWAARPPSREKRTRLPDRVAPIIFLAPALLFVSIALVIPALRTTYLSFQVEESDVDSEGDEVTEEVAGLENFRLIWEDDSIVSFDGLGSLRGGFTDGDFVTSVPFIIGAVVGVAAVAFVAVRGVSTRRGVDLSAPLPSISLTVAGVLMLLAAVSAFGGPVLWNNVFWIAFVAGFATLFGLAIAVLADRSRGESVAKSFIFMPMAISFVGASVIWTFVYEDRPPGTPQIGLLNAVWTTFGGDPQQWTVDQPWNTLFLIAIMIWIQTGFAMVILSAAIKGVPEELREAARIDGATEMQTFWRVTLPHIRSTVVVVITTLVVVVLKVYDIVQVMTSGQHRTDVIANRMFEEAFRFNRPGRGAALAVLLFIAVVPLMIVNVRRLRRQEATR